jgi:Transposase DDE domain
MERELWRSVYLLTRKLGNPWGSWRYSTAEVVGIYFWAVVHDRPTNWAIQSTAWPDDLRPAWLPSQSTMSRRLRKPETVELMTAVEQQLVNLLVLGHYLMHIVDGKALAVSAVSKDRDTGYGRGAGANQKGYKLHAIWSGGPIPVAWALAPMNTSEKTMARHLIPTLSGGGYLLADVQYDVGYLYELAAEAGFQLVAQKTKGRGLGHRRQHPGRLRSIELLKSEFGRELYNQRRVIECRFGTFTSVAGGLGPLPAWVRHFNRVRNWVQAKIITLAVRWLINHEPHKLALA